MNTPSKEALDAAENVQDYWGFPRRATMDLAAIIDRHFEPLRAEIVQLTIDRNNWKIRAEEMDEHKADCMERNHWRAYGYSGSNEGVGRTMRDALRAAIDAARKEVQP